MKQTFGFKAQMAIGDKGELDFLKYYTELAPVKSIERAIDFTLKDGKTVELKSDSYSMDDSIEGARVTENFFMETISHGTKNGGVKMGGVFRAATDKIDYFIYYYPANKTFFWFDTKSLCAEVEKMIGSKRFKKKSILNHGWITEGYALPRAELISLAIKVETFTENA